MSPAPSSSNRLVAIAALFAEFVALDPPTRRARLAALPDPALRHELESLLAADAEVDALLCGLEGIVAPLRLDGSPALAPGTIVGPYRIAGELGHGGMGVVYRAEDTRLRRTVALKFLPALGGPGARAQLLAEARAAAALDHPNVGVVHGVEEAPDGALFLVLACYDGETLHARLRRGPLPVAEAVDTARQVAAALEAAHRHGVVHRDVKPSNVLLLADAPAGARVKLLDFGIARLGGEGRGSAEALAGTAAYMAPEQARGAAADVRADLWALGVVLYEMLAGRRPFAGEGAALLHALRHEAPAALERLRPETPPALARLVHRLLDKAPHRRPVSAREVMRALDAVRFGHERRTRRLTLWGAGLAAALAAGAAVGLPLRHDLRAERAREEFPEIEQLIAERHFVEARTRLEAVAAVLGDDSTVARLGPLVTDTLVLTSTPAGAAVRLARFTLGIATPTFRAVGRTPLRLAVARADYLARFEVPGRTPVERLTPTEEIVPRRSLVHLNATFPAPGTVPDGMVPIPGGPYRLTSWDAPTSAEVTLAPFYLDRYEVTNRAFHAFVADGGYRDRRYWTLPFMDDGRALAWEEAMARLVDRTGAPGPRSWSGGTFPEGAADLPVTGVTAYEATAYAAWAGARLPTLFEWDKAARNGRYAPRSVMTPWGEFFHLLQPTIRGRANVEGRGPVAVGSYPFGLSPFGIHDLAGNVSEWVVGPMTSRGPRFFVTGGSWRDPIYLFGRYGTRDPFFASNALGFRCARSQPGQPAPVVRPFPPPPPPPVYHPAGDAAFASYLAYYDYDRRPLDVRVAATEETPDWTRFDLRYAGPDGFPYRAFLYLPRHARPPYQALVFAPHDGVFMGMDVPGTAVFVLGPHLRAGRAVLAVVPPGATGAPGPALPAFFEPVASVAYRNHTIHLVTAERLGVDLLLARPDIAADRIAYVTTSANSWKLIVPAVEPRFRSVVLIGSLLEPDAPAGRPEADPVNFAPHLQAPVLMLNGRYDETSTLATHVLPLWNLLPEPKRLAVVEGGHAPPPGARVAVIETWLDETLGPVDGGG